MYKLTTIYDGGISKETYGYSDALEAFDAFARCVDVGFGMETATYNLTLPNGKMYTKNFDRFR